MQISISSGNYNIVDSGQVFLFGESHDLKIEVDTNKDFAFSMVFDFWNDGTEEIKIENKVVGQEIVFDCYNFDDKGTGLSTPIEIAQIDGKKLFLSFWSYLEGKEDKQRVRSIKYTIFIEK